MNGRVFIPCMSEIIFISVELLKDYLVGFQKFHRSSSVNAMVEKRRKSANLEMGVDWPRSYLPATAILFLFIITFFTY